LAKSAYQGAGSIPSPWVIVLVAAILILFPTLFCTGVMMSANSTNAPSTEPAPGKR
jgi:hypothetical protein